MITLEMPVSGFGDLYATFFNAIALSFGTSLYQSLLQLSILLAGFSVLASLVLRRDLIIIIKWFFYFYILVYVCFLPKAIIEVTDHVNQMKPYRIANVPLGLAVVASLSARFSYSLTQLMEMNFSMPDDLTYHQTGMVFAAQLMKAASQFEITDPKVDANLQNFIQQCVFYDLWFKKYTLQDLVLSDDLWAFLKSQKMSPVRGIVYSNKNNEQTVMSCQEVFPLLEQDWEAALKNARSFYGTRLFGHAINPIESLNKYLPISYGFLTNLANTQADQIMKQTMMANAIERGALHMGAKVNADAALKSYSYVRANAQKRLTNQTVGEMACYWLPLIKVSLELILYGAFIFVLLIAVFPFGQKSLKGYLSTLVWIQLWPPLFALFHLIISFYGRQEVSAVFQSGISMQNLTSMSQITNDLVGLAGYMSMSVPAVAGFVLWGAQHSFAQVSQYIGGVTQSASSQAATEVASGNISLGNTSFGNHNSFNTSSNKMDTNMRVAGGANSIQLSDGTQLTAMSGGKSVLNMQSAISSTGVSIDFSENLRTSLNKSAEYATSSMQQNQQTYGHSETAVARSVNSLSHHLAESKAAGNSFTQSSSSGINKAFSEIERVNEEISNRTGLSRQEAEALSASIYAEGKVSAGFSIPYVRIASIGGSAGASRNTTNSDSNNLSRLKDEAKSVMDSHNYSENVDLVTRAVRDDSFRNNTEQGNRFTTDIGNSLDRADAAREEYSANLQKAEFFRKSANLVSEKGSAFRDNLSQEFIEYIARQPNQYGTGEIGAANVNSILQDRLLRERYAENFLHNKLSNIESNWSHGLRASNRSIEKQHQVNKNSIGTDRHIEAINKSNAHLQNDKIHIATKGVDLNGNIFKNEIDKQLIDTNDQLIQHKNAIKSEKQAVTEDTLKEINNFKRGTLQGNFAFGVDKENKDGK